MVPCSVSMRLRGHPVSANQCVRFGLAGSLKQNRNESLQSRMHFEMCRKPVVPFYARPAGDAGFQDTSSRGLFKALASISSQTSPTWSDYPDILTYPCERTTLPVCSTIPASISYGFFFRGAPDA